MNTDYYSRLGVSKNAEDKEIKNVRLVAHPLGRGTRRRTSFASCLTQAYRRAARQWHPDVNPSEEAKEKFQSINEAYSVRRRER